MNIVGAIIKQYKAYLHHPYIQNTVHTKKITDPEQSKSNPLDILRL